MHDFGSPQFSAMHQAWSQVTDEVRKAAKEVRVTSDSWRRCIKELRRITGDDRWSLMGAVAIACTEIHRLTSDFLLSFPPH